MTTENKVITKTYFFHEAKPELGINRTVFLDYDVPAFAVTVNFVFTYMSQDMYNFNVHFEGTPLPKKCGVVTRRGKSFYDHVARQEQALGLLDIKYEPKKEPDAELQILQHTDQN